MHPELPNNLEAESATLGCLLINPEAILSVASLLPDSSWFYLERHGIIYDAALDCLRRHVPTDLRTISDALKRAGKLDAIGGRGYLAELMDAVIHTWHAEYYAREVARTAQLRQIISAGGKIAALGYKQPDADTAQTEAQALLTAAVASRTDHGYEPLGKDSGTTFERLTSGDTGATSTGYHNLDELLSGGFRPGELIILAARPSVGKTSLALRIACNVANNGELTLIAELEMDRGSLQQRAVSMHSGIDLKSIRSNSLGDNTGALEQVVRSFGWLDALPLLVDDTPNQTIQHMRSHALRVIAERGPIALLTVDYLQLMNDTARRNSNREQDVSAISRGLKQLARELRCPILALSQLSRAVEGRQSHVPMLSDLRDSGAIEQDADVVMFIYREELYDRETDKKGIAELHIAKQRNGPLGVAPMRFDAVTTRFDDLTYRTVEGY